VKNVRANAKFWSAGIITALLGVALARAVGPSLVGPARIATVVAGQILALTGLFIICLGVRRRIKQTADH
jgi:hypothetical protein